jgi:hypothetical protein
MKKYMIKMAALLIFASVAISSCSLEARQGRTRDRGDRNRDRGHDRDHGHDGDHHYNQPNGRY